MYPRLLGIYAFGRFSRAKTDRKEFLCQEIKAQKDIRAIHANNLGYTHDAIRLGRGSSSHSGGQHLKEPDRKTVPDRTLLNSSGSYTDRIVE